MPVRRNAWLAGLVVIVALGGYLRFEGLGTRSLWRDELCTWHVSRMPLGESLKWGPELTKPPLYQLALRALTDHPKPGEWHLRLPAAVCGLALIVVGYWFAASVAGRGTGLALAGLLAFNDLQVFYSQEARPYSMLALGTALATLLWYRAVLTRRRDYLIGYVVAVTLTLYAHYLGIFAVAAHGLWWIWRDRANPTERRRFEPGIALAAIGTLCVPLVWRYLFYRSSIFQGLEWIDSPTVSSSIGVLSELSVGPVWLGLILLPALALWVAGARRRELPWNLRYGSRLHAGRDDICVLLLLCFAGSWGGLLVLSWLAHPAMVTRYALPAAIPLLLVPLIVAHRIDRRSPLGVMLFFVLLSAPQWSDREVDPGLRELAAHLRQTVKPESEAVVLTFDATVYPGWEDSERLVFNYYSLGNLPLRQLRLGPDNVTDVNNVLQDPRGLWLIVLWTDEMAVVQRAGRRVLPFHIDGLELNRLLFTPYRLVHIAPRPS